MRWLVDRPWRALILALVVEAVLVIVTMGDIVASDPLWYADIAHEIATDPSRVFDAPTNHPFEMRVGLTLPLAGFYKLFGVSTLVTNLPCLLAVLAILLVVHAAAPTPRAKLLGLAVGIACAPLLRHANQLNVDLPCAALLACTTLFLHRRDRGPAWFTLAMIAWFAAFLVKETALWLAPVWIWAFVVDVRANGLRATMRAFAPALAAGIALGAAYLVICARVWGDPLARFRGVDELTGGHGWSMVDKPASKWFARLVWGPAVLLAKQFQVLLVPALLAPWLLRDRERIWLAAAASIIGLFWFGSTSFSAYAPLPLLPRMIIAAAPPLLVLAAIAGDRALDRLPARARLPITLGFAAALLAPCIYTVAGALSQGAPERAAYATVRAAATDRTTIVVCGDPRCEATGNFHFGFERPSNVTIVYAPGFITMPRPTNTLVFALVHRRRDGGTEWTGTDVFDWRRLDALALPILLHDPDVTLYDAGDGTRLWDALQPR